MLISLKDQGHCIVFSSHVMQEVMMLCDQVVLIHEGVTVAHNSPQALCQLTNADNLEDAFIALIGGDQ
ncbi:MAG TPA: hypothetical protein EYQ12_05625 [Oceanospirillaceae bacterium]|jgi:sodium transport system ATP-binding protein|nr:hypothetical protein [Oceanospirillaceae bacterium]